MPAIARHPKSSKLWFRMAVPQRLREKVGKTEIKFSLGTSDPEQAKLKHSRAQAEWRQRFVELEREIEAELFASAPALVEQTLVAFTRDGLRDHVVLNISKSMSFRLVTSWGRDFYDESEADYAFGGKPDDADWDNIEEGPVIDVIAPEKRTAFVAGIRVHEIVAETQGMGHRKAVLAILKARRWDLIEPEVMLVESKTGVTIALGTPFYDLVAEEFLKALANHKFKGWNEGAMVAFLSDEPVMTHASEPAAPAPHLPKLAPISQRPVAGRRAVALSEALALWRKMQMPAKQSDLEVSRAVARFIELFGDKMLDAITSSDIFEYRDLIQKMPANLQISKIHAANKTLRQVIGEAEPNARRLTPTSVKKDLGGLQAVLSVAKSEQLVATNVAAEIRVAGYTKGKGRKKARLPFTPAMMKTLFASPIFTGCAGPRDFQRKKPGPFVYQDEMYWSFMLGGFAGPRLEEIGQIRLADIETIDLAEAFGPPWSGQCSVIYITGTGDFQSAKTEGSVRVLIVHPRLIELGFLDLVNRRRQEGADRLFELSKSTNDKWTKELSRRLNHYLDAVVTDDRHYVFHSSRHEWKDRADNSDIPEKLSDQMSGHANGSIGRFYGLGVWTGVQKGPR